MEGAEGTHCSPKQLTFKDWMKMDITDGNQIDFAPSLKRPAAASGTPPKKKRREELADSAGDGGKQEADDNVKPTHVLLYLAAATFKGGPGSRLADEIRNARALKLPIFLVRSSPLFDQHGLCVRSCAPCQGRRKI